MTLDPRAHHGAESLGVQLAGHVIALYTLWHAYRRVRWERTLKRIYSLWSKESYRLTDGWTYRADWVRR